MSSIPAPSAAPPPGETFASRYELLRQLGEGSVGAVYLARDRETGEHLALKQLFRVDQRSVARFKREFRLLADLHHPNCVKLYDLQHVGDAWFLSMEYVDGTDLEHTLIQPVRATLEATLATHELHRDYGVPDADRITRIAQAFGQLALGVRALHEAGMLHRDLKPSNVVIAKDGRVVVLDYGLVRGLWAPQNDVTLEGTVAGTPAYMPPEQALGEALTEASDWYAFGAMLYQALSGRLPIDGRNAHQLIQRKLREEPLLLERHVAPRALAQLCAALLKRDPAQRPGAAEILAVLGQLDREALREITITEERSVVSQTQGTQAVFFGRSAELQTLHAALTASRLARSTAVAHVHGTSGSGKSSLIEHFLDELQERSGSPFVLRSRCYEREAMPFKALDSVMDALVWHMAQLPDVEVAHLLPLEVAPLAQLFPVLERLRSVQRLLASGGKPRADAAHLRRRAELGLRELLANVALRHGLVLWIDDLQWGDLDSASLLQDWLSKPFDSPLLLLLSYRSEEVGTSPCLGALLGVPASAATARFDVALAQLRDADVQALCEQRLGSSSALAAVYVSRIVREAQGDAFLASQLAALALAKLSRGELDIEALSVQQLVLRTMALLTEPARELLNVLAIAGRPLTPQLALTAANAKQEGRVHIHALQGLRLLRTRNLGDTRLLEVYHDRVREAVLQSLSAERREQIHDRLLRNVETSGRADPGWLHELALGAGQPLLALRHGLLAAQLASESLAFERAAELYTRCANLAEDRSALAEIWSKLGGAQARCRRGALAAEAYLRASELAEGHARLPLLQLAASHLLRSGRYEEGERLVEKLLLALDIQVPRTKLGMYVAIGWELARVRWLLGRLKPRAGVELPADELRRGEYCGLVALDTQSYAPLRAALLQTRTLRMAFQYGEIETTARALALSATLSSLRATTEAAKQAHAQLDWADRLSLEVDQPMLRMEVMSARAVCGLSLGKMRDVIEASTAANAFYEARSAGGQHGDYYYMFAVRAVRIAALQNLGQHTLAAQELRELLALAEATSNRAAVLQATLVTTTMEQAQSACAGSRVRLDRELQELPRSTTGLLQLLHTTAVLRAACATGEHDWALEALARFWPGFQQSPVRRSAYLVYILHSARARLLLNRHVALGAETEAVDSARAIREDLRALTKQAPAPYRGPASARLCARLAYLRGDEAAALEHWRQSAEAHAEVGAVDEAARDRYALGALQAGEEGQRVCNEALESLRALGIVNPRADLRAYYPELLRPRRA